MLETIFKASPADSHVTFKLMPEVKETCRYFFKKHNLEHFYYVHYDKQKQKAIIVTTIPDYNRHVLSQRGFLKDAELTVGVHYLPSYKASYIRSEEGKRFNIDQAIELVQKPQSDQIEIFGFAAACYQPEKINFYLNHLEDLQQFGATFKNDAYDLINQYAKDPIILTEATVDATPLLPSKNIPLNKREREVLLGLYQGYSARETALQLNLSPRTVESYLDNAKNKLGVSKKVELLKYIIDSNLFS